MTGQRSSSSRAPARAALRFGRSAVLAALGAFAPLACGPADPGIEARYLPRHAHAAYGHSLAQSDLVDAALGRDWITAAERALLEPEAVELPLEVEGRFEAGTAEAFGYRFAVAPGRRLSIGVVVESGAAARTFVDLYEPGARMPRHVASAPPAARAAEASYDIELDVVDRAEYVLRVQPELLRGGRFTLTIETRPLLAFPVEGHDLRSIQSGFGAVRDGGRRSHRGVDIFADRGTKVLAAADGWVVRVGATGRGGNVVWLQPLFGDMRLYYAHLDRSFVERGQFIRAGDVVGEVGNTGNAATTPPHLHFGVYMRRRGARGGAQDPYELLD